jgi:hypothetical protein
MEDENLANAVSSDYTDHLAQELSSAGGGGPDLSGSEVVRPLWIKLNFLKSPKPLFF